MALNVICPSCGAENMLDLQRGDAAGLRCGVCGEPLDAGPRQCASPRKSAFGRPESGNASGGPFSASNSGGGSSLEPDAGGHEYRERAPSGYRPSPGHGEVSRKRPAIPVFGQIMIVIIVLTFISSVYVDKKDNAFRLGTKAKICVSNMKTIEGAMELYLMENDLRSKKFMIDEFEIGRLTMNGYLRSEPKCPDRGRYTIKLDRTNDRAAVRDVSCSKHGSLFEKTGEKGL